jgi:hypothetical protein
MKGKIAKCDRPNLIEDVDGEKTHRRNQTRNNRSKIRRAGGLQEEVGDKDCAFDNSDH